MADETKTQPGEAQPGKPAGEAKPAAESKPDQEGDDKYLALRNRAIDAERKAQKLEEQIKKAGDEKLAEQGKYQELAKAKESEAENWRSKYVQAQRSNALIAAGAKADVIDANDLVLAKLGEVDVDDDSALREAAEKAVGELKKSKPYLFGKANGKNGQPFTTPQATPGGTTNQLPAGKITAADVHKMTPEQRKAFLDQVSKAPFPR